MDDEQRLSEMECIGECYPQLKETMEFLIGALLFVILGFILGSINESAGHRERLQEVREQHDEERLRWHDRMIKQRSRW